MREEKARTTTSCRKDLDEVALAPAFCGASPDVDAVLLGGQEAAHYGGAGVGITNLRFSLLHLTKVKPIHWFVKTHWQRVTIQQFKIIERLRK